MSPCAGVRSLCVHHSSPLPRPGRLAPPRRNPPRARGVQICGSACSADEWRCACPVLSVSLSSLPLSLLRLLPSPPSPDPRRLQSRRAESNRISSPLLSASAPLLAMVSINSDEAFARRLQEEEMRAAGFQH